LADKLQIVQRLLGNLPLADRRWEIRLTAQLVGALFADTKDLGDLNHSKELLPS
jgi:hypothetical protein